MGELYMKICFAFLKDINVPGRVFEECFDRLYKVFGKLRLHNLKLNGKKCNLFKRKLVSCGHIISEEGIATDPSRIEKVTNWPQPLNVKSLRIFLGFSSYYRRFVANFAQIAKPLCSLIAGGPKKRSKLYLIINHQILFGKQPNKV